MAAAFVVDETDAIRLVGGDDSGQNQGVSDAGVGCSFCNCGIESFTNVRLRLRRSGEPVSFSMSSLIPGHF